MYFVCFECLVGMDVSLSKKTKQQTYTKNTKNLYRDMILLLLNTV